jgi:hypothetical protein
MAYQRQMNSYQGRQQCNSSFIVKDVGEGVYRSQYEGAFRNFAPRGRANKKNPLATCIRSELIGGKETICQVTEALDSKIGVGLEPDRGKQDLTAVTLLVTTRTLGFCAAQIYYQASAHRNPVFCNIYAFYRVNLAVFDARLYAVRQIQEAPVQRADETYEIPTRPDCQTVMKISGHEPQMGLDTKTY